MLTVLISSLIALSNGVSAQHSDLVAKLRPLDFPEQPIQYAVAYSPGQSMDISARLLAKYAEKASGYAKILVYNLTGGEGLLGHAYVASQAKPDGHSVAILGGSFWGDAMLRSEGRWSASGVEPIAYINTESLTWIRAAKGRFTSKTVEEIIQVAKIEPGSVRVAFVPNTISEYLLDQLEAQTGAKFLRVSYQNELLGIKALFSGDIDVAQGFVSEFYRFIKDEELTLIAVASAVRVLGFKDVPTFNEICNSHEHVWSTTRFAAVPKGTPDDRKNYLAAAIEVANNNPELILEYEKLGVFIDENLSKSKTITADLTAIAKKERDFYIKTGRLKP